MTPARSRRFLVAVLVAGAFAACLLPGEPPDAERISFSFGFAVPYRVLLRGTVREPAVTVMVDSVPLAHPTYRFESLRPDVVGVDAVGQQLVGIARDTASVRVVYVGATGTPDTVFQVQVVVSGIAITPAQQTLTRVYDTTRLKATALAADTSAVLGTPFTWSSSNSLVAKVSSSGLVTAVNEGTATISATADGVTGACLITVVQAAARVQVVPRLDTLRAWGDSTKFRALAWDSTGQLFTALPRWSSTVPTVARVDSTTGLATATGGGTAKIVARVGSATDTARLVVAQVALSVSVKPLSLTLTAISDTGRLIAEVRDSTDSLIHQPSVSWAIDDSTVASVDQTGLLKARANGTALVTASSGGQSGFSAVVVRQEVGGVEIVEDSVALVGPGATAQLHAVAADRNGYPISGAAAGAVNWGARLTCVATVDSTGLVTARGEGRTIVTAFPSAGAAGDSAVVQVSGASGASQELVGFVSSGAIQVARPDGTCQSVLISNAVYGFLAEPVWSADGTRLAFGRVVSGVGPPVWTVYVARADGSAASALRSDAGYDNPSPAWSPDGGKIAFISDSVWASGYNGQLYVMNADGSNPTRLVQVATHPTWSPDGRRIAFTSSDGISMVNADGSGFRTLLGVSGAEEAAWSPDGSQLAFAYQCGVWVVNSDGSSPRSLTVANGYFVCSGAPAWSPDGSQLAFEGSTSADCDYGNGCYKYIYVMNRDGSGVRSLTGHGCSYDWYGYSSYCDPPETDPNWRVAAPLGAPPLVGPSSGPRLRLPGQREPAPRARRVP